MYRDTLVYTDTPMGFPIEHSTPQHITAYQSTAQPYLTLDLFLLLFLYVFYFFPLFPFWPPLFFLFFLWGSGSRGTIGDDLRTQLGVAGRGEQVA